MTYYHKENTFSELSSKCPLARTLRGHLKIDKKKRQTNNYLGNTFLMIQPALKCNTLLYPPPSLTAKKKTCTTLSWGGSVGENGRIPKYNCGGRNPLCTVNLFMIVTLTCLFPLATPHSDCTGSTSGDWVPDPFQTHVGPLGTSTETLVAVCWKR